MNSLRYVAHSAVFVFLVFLNLTVLSALERIVPTIQPNGETRDPDISANGRFIVFSSIANNLLAEDSDTTSDVYLFDRQTNTLELISVNSSEVKGNGSSGSPVVSDDGNYVAFYSGATNLVGSDLNGRGDIFIRNRAAGTTEIVSVSSSEVQGTSSCINPSISGNGMFVAFESFSNNLVTGDTNGHTDVFVRDVAGGTTERISIGDLEQQSTGISGNASVSFDGRYVAFESAASNLIQLDTNNSRDVFIRDRGTGGTIRVSVSDSEAEGNSSSQSPSLSNDGTLVAFHSSASNLIGTADTNSRGDIFVRNLNAQTTERISIPASGGEGDADCYDPCISPDGRFVTFESESTNMVPEFTTFRREAYLRNRSTGETMGISQNSSGGQSSSFEPGFTFVASDMTYGFVSEADDLVANDTNMTYDVFFEPGPALSRRPTVRVSGRSRITTKKKRYTLRGTASDPDDDLARVEGKDTRPSGSRKYRKARGTSRWRYVAPLRKGRNTIQIRAVDATGKKSATKRIKIRKK